MHLPDIVHPKIFTINGHRFQVVSYMQLTDAQARQIALHGYQSKRWTAADKKKLTQLQWAGESPPPGVT